MNHHKLVQALLAWFGHHARDLPWRRTRDPYAIWVSEIMLQQTQVKTVLPYWERWMQTLPDLQSLASAHPQTLHKLWEGLGYYTRVRNLQKAAQVIIASHGGEFPTRFEDVLALPGIGPYTAGAVCSIAFNQPTPILDGNVMRVLTRLFAIPGDPRSKEVNPRLWRLAEELVQEAATQHATRNTQHASHLNQSLMELGALVCTARNPRCVECPLTKHCTARRQDRVAEFPEPVRRPKPTPRRFAAFVVARDGRFLVRQRPPGQVNAHLWEFPNTELSLKCATVNRAAHQSLGTTPASLVPFCTLKHSITRYRITLEVFRAELNGAPARPPGRARWLAPAQLRTLAFTSAHKKVLHLVT